MTVTTFSELELDESLLEALQDKGFTRPTAIQAAAIPPALDGRDVLGSAPTGTGKTAAYLLPALQHLLDFPRKKSGPPRILILTQLASWRCRWPIMPANWRNIRIWISPPSPAA